MGNIETCPVPEEFDRKAAQAFMDDVLKKVDALAPGGRVVFDFSRTRYVSSSGISAVIRLYKECRLRGAELVLVAPSVEVRSVLLIAGLDRLLKVLSAPPEEENST